MHPSTLAFQRSPEDGRQSVLLAMEPVVWLHSCAVTHLLLIFLLHHVVYPVYYVGHYVWTSTSEVDFPL